MIRPYFWCKSHCFKFIVLFYTADLEAKCSSRVCNQAGTYENILANFCQADFGKNIIICALVKLTDHLIEKYLSAPSYSGQDEV